MKTAILLILISIGFASCDLEQILNASSSTTTSGITEQEAATGLKDALSVGISKSAEMLSRQDAYFADPLIHIPWPDDALKVAGALRKIGLNQMVDNVELSLNRAAEDAAIKAKPIFIAAIKKMTLSDAMNILFGSKDAATQYLKKTTSQELTNAFRPVIETSLEKVNATKYWNEVMTRYNQIPFVKPVTTDLPGFVTGKALEGLFLKVADEEAKIRENPLERTTAMLKKVFGYYDKHKNQ